uniref:Uncharacterized protein n=1 Tax=Arundo donax TaxID=35708 RepID=A0A0A9GIH1_ARUDO
MELVWRQLPPRCGGDSRARGGGIVARGGLMVWEGGASSPSPLASPIGPSPSVHTSGERGAWAAAACVDRGGASDGRGRVRVRPHAGPSPGHAKPAGRLLVEEADDTHAGAVPAGQGYRRGRAGHVRLTRVMAQGHRQPLLPWPLRRALKCRGHACTSPCRTASSMTSRPSGIPRARRDEEGSEYTNDGTVDINQNPALKRSMGNWRTCFLF